MFEALNIGNVMLPYQRDSNSEDRAIGCGTQGKADGGDTGKSWDI